MPAVLHAHVPWLDILQTNCLSKHGLQWARQESVRAHRAAARTVQECNEMQQLTGTVTSEGLKGDCQYRQAGQHAPFLTWPLPAWHGHLASCAAIRTTHGLVCAHRWGSTRSKLTCDSLHDHGIAMLRGDTTVARQPLVGTKTPSQLQNA